MTMKDTREQQRIVDQIKSKLIEKERAERDIKIAKDKINQNPKDDSFRRQLNNAEMYFERADNEIERLVNQLGY